MGNELLSLNQLLKNFKIEVENLEKQIKDKKEKIKVVFEAMKLLEQEGGKQLTLLEAESLSEKYKDMSLNKATLEILKNSEKYLNGTEIFDELIRNGFKSGSSDIKRDVYICLYRLEKENKIISKTIENRKKYFFKPEIKVLKKVLKGE